MAKRNPAKALHDRRAREHLATARNYLTLAEGSAMADEVLTLAHCEACSAMTEATNAKAEHLRTRAAELSSRIARRFHRPGQNPLTAGLPPAHVHGMPGAQQVWRYKGREITVTPYPKMPDAPWMAEWTSDEGDEEQTFGTDPQAVLANARYRLDVDANEEKWPEMYHSAETMAHHVLDSMVDGGKGPIDRAALAEHIEAVAYQMRRYPDEKPSLYGLDLPVRPWGMAAFDGLPLKERLKLLDELIDYQYRWGFIPDARYRPTPSHKRVRNPKKKGKRRDTREERQRRLRRLLRV
jgi:hypothetical protein